MEQRQMIRYGMKKKTICKVLQRKILEWMSTITDNKVRDLVRRDTIVTGGSIASMLLGEKINDFDVYFKTRETALAVARYYKLPVMEDRLREYAAEHLDGSVKELVDTEETLALIKNTLHYVMGDDVNEKKHTQFTSTLTEYQENIKNYGSVMLYADESIVASEGADEYQQYLDGEIDEEDKPEEQKGKYEVTFYSENAITLTNKLQVILRFTGEPEEIHDNFDFVHAMNYYEFGTNNLVLKQQALESLMSRTLIYKGSLFPICSLLRMRKFINRGWRISGGQILKMAMQISDLDLRDPRVLKTQLIGVDMLYFHSFIAALENKDLRALSATYLYEIIDRVFGEN